MFIILEILVITAYLFSDMLGLLMAVIMFASIWLNKKYNLLNKIVISLILSVPIFQIGFLGKEMHHLSSWYMIFLIILIIYLFNNLIKKEIMFSKLPLLLVSIALGILIINNLVSKYCMENLIEYVQIILMVIPILIVYQQRKYLNLQIDEQTKETWIKFTNISIISVAIGTLIQYVIYNTTGTITGSITVYNSRTIYDLLFKGASVLSMYLGIGIVLNMSLFLENHKLKNILAIFICMVGIVINSSRTGLISATIVCVLIIGIKSKKSMKNLVISAFVCIVGIFAFYIAAQSILQNRVVDGLLGDNGRFDTYIHGLETFFCSGKNALFGIGLSSMNYDFTFPHNFILQTMLTMGGIVTIIWIVLIGYILKYVNKTDFRYILWHIFISSMLITSFQDMSFITLFIILAILFTPIETNNN